MKVLVVGGSGQLGRELQETAPPGFHLNTPGSASLDLLNSDMVRTYVRRFAPDIVLNSAGYTAVDAAEDNSEKAFAVNGEGAGILAEAAGSAGARLIHVSTDFVFDGCNPVPYGPDAAPSPCNAYGASKLDGEQRIIHTLGDKALILRTAWLYSVYGGNFVKTMLRLMAQRDHLIVVSDQIGTPTWGRGLAKAIWRAVEKPVFGIHHWTDAGVASWYDFAVAIYEEGRRRHLLHRDVEITPVDTAAYPTKARRPAYSVLDKTASWAALEQRPPHWRYQLGRMLDRMAQADQLRRIV